jgi:hypothetical protein
MLFKGTVCQPEIGYFETAFLSRSPRTNGTTAFDGNWLLTMAAALRGRVGREFCGTDDRFRWHGETGGDPDAVGGVLLGGQCASF